MFVSWNHLIYVFTPRKNILLLFFPHKLMDNGRCIELRTLYVGFVNLFTLIRDGWHSVDTLAFRVVLISFFLFSHFYVYMFKLIN